MKQTLLLSVLLGSLSVISAAQVWEKKDYREWSEKDCQKLLQDSPWAQRYVLSQVIIEPLTSDPTERGRETNPQMIYQVQFRSALPIREAMVRQQQLRAKYDTLDAERKQAFDAQVEEFLSKDFPDRVIVYVAYGSNVAYYDRDLARHWQTQTTETLKNFVYLIGADGVKAPLLQYTVEGGGGRAFQMIFPRQVEGHPLVGPDDKSLQLEFPHPTISNQGGSRVLVQFPVKKMLVDGVVVY